MTPSRVALVCPACETRREVTPDRIGAVLARHNRQRHGGAAVASVAGAHVDRLEVGP